MTAMKTTSASGVAYSIVDAHGKTTTVKSAAGGKLIIENNSNSITLTTGNVNDLVVVLQAFQTNGGIT